MKKVMTGILAAALVLTVGTTSAFAVGRRANYVDANGDGVCDNYGTGRGQGMYYVDANGDGVCDNYGTGRGQGMYYVDANGDGVCDNYGMGRGAGFRGGRGR